MPHGEEQSHNAPSWRPILETGDPDGKIWSPGMVDVPLRGNNGIHNWFWAPGQDKGVYSKDQLVKMYYDSVARNCNFIVGEVVNPEGLVPEYDIQELAKFGDEIKRRFDKPVGKTTGVGRELTLELRKPQKIDHVVIQEQLEHGERIRSYRIEGKSSGNNWEELCSGISVGHKRIQRFDPRHLSAIRLKIDQAKATPVIRNLAVFHSGNK
jgi:alpha-L-fucosidase